jgi:hypothetical protein
MYDYMIADILKKEKEEQADSSYIQLEMPTAEERSDDYPPSEESSAPRGVLIIEL